MGVGFAPCRGEKDEINTVGGEKWKCDILDKEQVATARWKLFEDLAWFALNPVVMDNSLPPPPPGNMMGRQRKMRQEQSVELFPPLNGVAVGVAETSTKKKMEKEGGSKSISSRSTDQSGSVYSRSSYFSCRSDRSSSRFSSSTPSFRSSSPCEPTCNPVTLYLRSISGNTPSTGTRRCSTSLPESIVEEEDDIDEEKATGESRANESGLKKKKKKRKKRKRRNTIVTSTGVSSYSKINSH